MDPCGPEAYGTNLAKSEGLRLILNVTKATLGTCTATIMQYKLFSLRTKLFLNY